MNLENKAHFNIYVLLYHFKKIPINTLTKAGDIIHILLICIKKPTIKNVFNCIVKKNTGKYEKSDWIFCFAK